MILVAAAAATIPGPLRSAVEIGFDEHFEVTKALLWMNDSSSYENMWNDQPPIHTAILGGLFKIFGPSIGVARSLAVWFGVFLLLGCYVVVTSRCGALAGYLATASLLIAPTVIELCVSVMLEAPSMALALWSLRPLQSLSRGGSSRCLVVAGGILGAALQVKLTAAIVVPALIFEIVLGSYEAVFPLRITHVRRVAIWAASAMLVFVILGWILGTHYRDAWASHFSHATRFSPELNKHTFPVGKIFDHTEAVFGAGIGLLVVLLRRDWRKLAFPIIMLCTALGVHMNHRPWWNYYYLHLAIPLAWLSGYAISASLKSSLDAVFDASVRGLFLRVTAGLTSMLLVFLMVVDGGQRLNYAIDRIQIQPRKEGNRLIEKMEEFAPLTKWTYTRSSIYPFHAKLRVIPELAVLPFKRYWSGEITRQGIWEIVKQYQPQQLLLDESLDQATQEFVDKRYTLVFWNEEFQLYVENAVVVQKMTLPKAKSAVQ